MLILVFIKVNVQTGEVLDFSLTNIFSFICTKICSFVLIKANVQNGEVLDFSLIKYFFVY